MLVAVGLLSGCISEAQDEVPATEIVEEQPVVAPKVQLEVPDGVDPVRIVLAFVLLSSGDIEAAISEGLVSPDEVAIAVTAVDDGTIQDWIDAAEESVASVQ
jgi:hypothetical protein